MVTSALSSAEVAALVGVPERQVRKEVEHGVVGAGEPPRFAFDELVYFRAVALLGLSLGVEDRSRLHRAITAALASGKTPTSVALSSITEVKIGDIVIELRERLNQFERWKSDRVQRDPLILSGEPTFKGTRLSIRHIGTMLLRGAPAEEVTEDYPYLSGEDLEFAKLFTAAYPPRGRPRESHKASHR